MEFPFIHFIVLTYLLRYGKKFKALKIRASDLDLVITARKRSLGQGNIFTPVCHSVHRGACIVGGAWLPGGGACVVAGDMHGCQGVSIVA